MIIVKSIFPSFYPSRFEKKNVYKRRKTKKKCQKQKKFFPTYIYLYMNEKW